MDEQLQNLIDDTNHMRQELEPLIQEVSRLQSIIAKNENKIEKMKELIAHPKDDYKVSDHAVVRFLERKYGFTFDSVREEMLSPTVKLAMEMGCNSVKVDGGNIKIKDKTITTYIPKR